MMKKNLENIARNAVLFVGLKGCELTCHDANGTVVWAIGYSGGRYELKEVVPYIPAGHSLALSGACSVMERVGRGLIQTFGELMYETGANPDFQPTKYTADEIRMRNLVDDMATKSAMLQDKIDRMSLAERGLVVEDKSEKEVAKPEKEVAKPEKEVDQDGDEK